MRKVLVLVLVLLMCGFVVFAGGKQEEAATETKEDDEIIIGFNNGSTTVDFLRQVGESMERAAEEYGVKLLVAESNFDPEKILPNVDNMLLQGADLIVDFNVNAEIGGSLVDYCGQQGVPVIGIDVLYTAPDGEQGWFSALTISRPAKYAGKVSRKPSRNSGAENSNILFSSSTRKTGTSLKRGFPVCTTD